MDTFYWFRDGQFGEVHAYTWAEAEKAIGTGKYVVDTTGTFNSVFLLVHDDGRIIDLPRWAMPKEFLLRLVLLGVGI